MNQQKSMWRGCLTVLVWGAMLLPIGASVAVAQNVAPNDPMQPAPAAPQAKTAAPATQPSVDMVQAAIDAKEYSTAVKLAAKLLSLHGPAAGGVSRFQVTMLKGDAQAGLKSVSAAVMTYKSAMKESQDPREIALAQWTAELFHTAGSTTYTPKMIGVAGQQRGPFDLLNPDQRREGFGALLDDRLSLLEPKIKKATVSQSLPQIWPVLQQVVDLDQLDGIANGNDDKTTTLAGSLLDHSRNLLTNALKSSWARLNDIDNHANQTSTVQQSMVVNGSYVTENITRKNGLSQQNKNELGDMITLAQKIHDAANVFMSVAKTDQGWSTILSDSDRVAGRASDLINADYGQTLTTTTDPNQQGYMFPNGTQQGTTGIGTATSTAQSGNNTQTSTSSTGTNNPPPSHPGTGTKKPGTN